jgi:osmotically-inducible protein OsmY
MGVSIFVLILAFLMGCASSPKHEGTGEYVDDSAITTKVKAAIFAEPTLKSAEIGFVTSQADINKAATVARGVSGVKSVKNDMRLK